MNIKQEVPPETDTEKSKLKDCKNDITAASDLNSAYKTKHFDVSYTIFGLETQNQVHKINSDRSGHLLVSFKESSSKVIVFFMVHCESNHEN